MPMVRRSRTAVFISGRGSNLQALITEAYHTDYPASIELVISDNPVAQGISIGQNAGIPTYMVDKKKFRANKDIFEHMLKKILEAYHIDFVCLAGFMHILSPYFVAHWCFLSWMHSAFCDSSGGFRAYYFPA
jgi:phosphoribosylglycinamide formyltransferase-1